MNTHNTPWRTTRATLRPGQSLRWTVRQGAQILVLRGTATLHLPMAWVGGSVMLAAPIALREGERYAVAAATDLQLAAVEGCEVARIEPAGLGQQAASALTALAGWVFGQPVTKANQPPTA